MKLWKLVAWIALGLLAALAGWYYLGRGMVKYGPPPLQAEYGPPPAGAPAQSAETADDAAGGLGQ